MVVRLLMRDLLLWYVVGEDRVLARASTVRGLYSENPIHLNDKMPQTTRVLELLSYMCVCHQLDNGTIS
jgi:hypothetical protein